MRKAFDANVPKLKPRLKTAAVAPTAPEAAAVPPLSPTGGEGQGEGARPMAQAPHPDPLPAERGEGEKVSAVVPAPVATRSGPSTRAAAKAQSQSPSTSAGPLFDIDARRERLEKIKRKVAEAARTGARVEPVPEEPARAAESVLGLVHDLETKLSRARDLEDALRADLAQARGELARTVSEGRTAAERLGQIEVQLDEKRQVLEEMLGEMGALEEERDQAVRRAQALAALDEERQRLLDDLGRRATETEKALAESRAEAERLSTDLDARLTEGARLRSGLAEVTRERDSLARDAERLTRERDELLEAKRALEKVHQALSQARARLGS